MPEFVTILRHFRITTRVVLTKITKAMTKEVLETMKEIANDVSRNIQKAISELTRENPLVLFTDDQANAEADDIYEFPYAYYVDKYSGYNQGAIQNVSGNDVTIFLTGDEFGNKIELDLSEVPFSSQVDLLNYLIERM